jgi:hypothetical protein
MVASSQLHGIRNRRVATIDIQLLWTGGRDGWAAAMNGWLLWMGGCYGQVAAMNGQPP